MATVRDMLLKIVAKAQPLLRLTEIAFGSDTMSEHHAKSNFECFQKHIPHRLFLGGMDGVC